ncbi:hypothetical protein KC678_04125 [Candidatus Dojkabacteria bacterium]|uniref:EF-hand domain-containing protein n=1 Tax=Candidatus Dojkabacteria bacterium TaxID=2099670 RepID=A0A955L206_9BACT|nr:hypothetical protein [Candidatus Dojkabacteria bacterium]
MTKQKTLLLVWILVAFILSLVGGFKYLSNQNGSNDVSVADNAYNCTGGCVYLGTSTDYAIGTLCRGSASGGAKDQYTNTCYKCIGDNNFAPQDSVSACNICYGQCVGDSAITEYSQGEQCAVTNDSAVETGVSTGTGQAAILSCNNGLWEYSTQAKCFGQCRGDKAGSLYDQGYTCLDPRTDNYCWVCEDPKIKGHGEYGGMNYYEIGNSKCDSVRAQVPTYTDPNSPDRPIAVYCTPETQDTCINDIVDGGAPRNYAVGEICHTTLKVSSQYYGTYKCVNNGAGTGVFTKENVTQKCESEGTLYDLGETITWLSSCYQCTNPGEKTSINGTLVGGFTLVDSAACPTLTGSDVQNPGDTCTNEVKTCPGGATVTRNANRQCDFDPCPVVNNQSCTGICKGDTDLKEYGVGTTCFGGTVDTTSSCYECTGNGFLTRESTVCQTGQGIGGGVSIFDPDNNPTAGTGHDKVGACLGDLNENQTVDLQDFAQFAKLFNKVLTGDERKFDIVNPNPSEFIINLDDFAQFAKNFGKDTTNCSKREVALTIN